jgi:hypothetical protein
MEILGDREWMDWKECRDSKVHKATTADPALMDCLEFLEERENLASQESLVYWYEDVADNLSFIDMPFYKFCKAIIVSGFEGPSRRKRTYGHSWERRYTWVQRNPRASRLIRIGRISWRKR